MLDEVRALAQRLDAAPHGDRGRIVQQFADHFGWSPAKTYRELKRVGWSSGRKPRADRGKTRQDEITLTTLASTLRLGLRKNGKATMHTPTAVSMLSVNGYEFKVGNARINSLLRRQQLNTESQRQGKASQPQRSLHPNHVHLVDPSLCLIYYLPDGGQAVIRDDEAYKNKPENIESLGDLKVWRYVLADHYSGTYILRYYQAKGETQANLFDFLLYCWQQLDGRAFHGVPKILYWDKGSANTAAAIKNALRALEVTPIEHEAGNPRAKGAVEVANNIIETHFESRLKYEPVRNVDELNAAAEAWYNAFNADRIPNYDARLKRKGMAEPMSRYGLWQTVRQEHLRLLPDPEICRYLLSADPQERQVRADLTISFKHPAAKRTQHYDVSHLPNIYPRATVRVSPLVYGNLQVLVYVADYKGEEQSFAIEPIAYDERSGFRMDAAVIGEEMKSQPDTTIDSGGKAADQAAFPGKDVAAIKKARDRNEVPFEGRINAHSHLADIVPPSYMRRPGTELDVPNRARPETKPLSITEACKRLVLELGPAADGASYYELVKGWYPDGVPETEFEELVARIRGDNNDGEVTAITS